MPLNEFQQDVGEAVPDWQSAHLPDAASLDGQFCQLQAYDLDRHAAALYAQFAAHDELWTYMGYGPFADASAYRACMQGLLANDDNVFYAIVDKQNGQALGQAAYLRIAPQAGSIEVGHICYSPALQQTPIASESMYLLMAYAFDLGYRRYEWKCDACNAPSQSAAQRLGFAYEGTFRQALVYKGRNRDTAWYAIIDKEWPTLQSAYEAWLTPSNFDEGGKQKQRLSVLSKNALQGLR